MISIYRDFFIHSEKTALENIDDLLNGCISLSDAKPWYNTWPFGNPATEVCSRFVAICRKDRNLHPAFDIILKQSKKIATKYPYDSLDPKTVVLLTDKWNNMVFKKYEKQLLLHAINDGIWYIFLLVSDYGYTEIPFLPHDRDTLKQFQRERIEDDLTFDELCNHLLDYPFEYEVSSSTWNQNGAVRYQFYIDTFTWSKASNDSLCGNIEGRLDENGLRRFLDSLAWLVDDKRQEIKTPSFAKDAQIHKLQIFGKTIEWDNASSGENGEEVFIQLKKALDRFLKSCEKIISTGLPF